MVEAKQRGVTSQTVRRARKLRRRSTEAEKTLWACLRNRKFKGYKFRRQHPLGRLIVDFYCSEARLAIELDGAGHAMNDQNVYDQERTETLGALDVQVIRFWNDQVLHKTADVLDAIASAIEERSL